MAPDGHRKSSIGRATGTAAGQKRQWVYWQFRNLIKKETVEITMVSYTPVSVFEIINFLLGHKFSLLV